MTVDALKRKRETVRKILLHHKGEKACASDTAMIVAMEPQQILTRTGFLWYDIFIVFQIQSQGRIPCMNLE